MSERPFLRPDARLVTVKEVAVIAGVVTSAVSNWRKRYADFPARVDESPSGDLFELSAVLQWMDSHGKKSKVATSRADRDLWAIVVDQLRGSLTPEDTALVALQVMYLAAKAAWSQQILQERPKSAFANLTSAGVKQIRKVWEQSVGRVKREESRPELERALELPRDLSDHHLDTIVHAIAEHAGRGTDWSSLSTSFLRRAQDEIAIRGVGQATTSGLAKLMIAMLQPIEGVVYDPAAGNAMVLAESSQLAKGGSVRLVGQEVNEFSWRVGYLHLALQRTPFDFEEGDTLRSDRFRKVRADRIALDPPIGMRYDSHESPSDERWTYGTTTHADWMWAQHLLFHLADDGTGVMVIAAGALTRGGRDAHIRGGIVSADLLDAVVELPPGIIPGISDSVALLVFAKNRANRSGAVLFVDARQLGTTRRGKAHELTVDDISRVATTNSRWRAGTFCEEPLYAASATLAEIDANAFDLSAKRYVRYVAPEDADSETAKKRLRSATQAATESLSRVQSQSEPLQAALSQLRIMEETEWPLVRLGDLLATGPVTGTRQDSNGDDEERPWIPTRLVSGSGGRITKHLDQRTRGRTRGRLARRGDVLLTSRGIEMSSRAFAAIVEVDGEMAFAESLMLLRPDLSRIRPDFLRYALTSRSGQAALVAATTGSVIANLRTDALAEVQLRVPNLVAQAGIVEVLNTIESVLAFIDQASVDLGALLEISRNEVALGRIGLNR